MTTMLPSPFLTESYASVETLSGVSTAVEAAAPVLPPQLEGAAAETETPHEEASYIHEIFHHARRLNAEARRRAQIDQAGLQAVAAEIASWMDDRDPMPIFLTREA